MTPAACKAPEQQLQLIASGLQSLGSWQGCSPEAAARGGTRVSLRLRPRAVLAIQAKTRLLERAAHRNNGAAVTSVAHELQVC